MCIKISDSGSRQKAENIDIMVLSCQLKFIIQSVILQQNYHLN